MLARAGVPSPGLHLRHRVRLLDTFDLDTSAFLQVPGSPHLSLQLWSCCGLPLDSRGMAHYVHRQNRCNVCRPSCPPNPLRHTPRATAKSADPPATMSLCAAGIDPARWPGAAQERGRWLAAIWAASTWLGSLHDQRVFLAGVQGLTCHIWAWWAQVSQLLLPDQLLGPWGQAWSKGRQGKASQAANTHSCTPHSHTAHTHQLNVSYCTVSCGSVALHHVG